MSTDRVYTVTRDGATVAEVGSENEAFIWLHRNQPHSWDYALTYGGYAVINPYGVKVEA